MAAIIEGRGAGGPGRKRVCFGEEHNKQRRVFWKEEAGEEEEEEEAGERKKKVCFENKCLSRVGLNESQEGCLFLNECQVGCLFLI